ncbi:MAG TPA: carboxymuconolactone decarboxylase family protein [Gaiellaceae bacterium]|nr:carboxymuconolactone decarboxylase family protein [Gaiellaceae bacterium]
MQATATIDQRMPNIPQLVPDAFKALLALSKAAKQSDLPATTAFLVHLRASQINGCSYCAEMHARELKEAGESDERIWTVAAWREAPYFTEAERAALALTEAVTRLSDRADPVPDEIFEEASRHYDEQALASLIIEIAAINVWNRFNVTVRQPAGAVPG